MARRIDAVGTDCSPVRVLEGLNDERESLEYASRNHQDGRAFEFSAGTVQLRLTLATKARLTLGVYSVDGRLQRKLIAASPMEVGSHALAWDLKDDRGRRVAGGVYFIRAEQDCDGAAATRLASSVVVVR